LVRGPSSNSNKSSPYRRAFTLILPHLNPPPPEEGEEASPTLILPLQRRGRI